MWWKLSEKVGIYKKMVKECYCTKNDRLALIASAGWDQSQLKINFSEGKMTLTANQASGDYDEDVETINFCPYCGRKLSENLTKESAK